MTANPLMKFSCRLLNPKFSGENTLSAAAKESCWSTPLKRQMDTESGTLLEFILASTIPELAASSFILISQIVHRIVFLGFVYYVSQQ